MCTKLVWFDLVDGLDPATALHRAQGWLCAATVQEMGLVSYDDRFDQESGRRDREVFYALRYYRANPHIKPFAHPYYWAAFVYSGDGV